MRGSHTDGINPQAMLLPLVLTVADIVRDCTHTSPEAKPSEKEPWLLRKTRYLDSLAGKPISSLLVTAADKAHNAGDMVLDARRDPAMMNCARPWSALSRRSSNNRISPELSPLLLRPNTRLRMKPAINPASTPVMNKRVGAKTKKLIPKEWIEQPVLNSLS